MYGPSVKSATGLFPSAKVEIGNDWAGGYILNPTWWMLFCEASPPSEQLMAPGDESGADLKQMWGTAWGMKAR